MDLPRWTQGSCGEQAGPLPLQTIPQNKPDAGSGNPGAFSSAAVVYCSVGAAIAARSRVTATILMSGLLGSVMLVSVLPASAFSVYVYR